MRTRLAVALLVVAMGVTSCGDGDNAPDAAPSDPAAADLPVIIELRVKLPRGRVLPSSQIGNDQFCPGGVTFDDAGDGSNLGQIVTNIACQDGGLQIAFSPTQQGLTQHGTWMVVTGTGTGDFAGFHGTGEVTAEFEDEKSGKGRVQFTGIMGPPT